MKMKALLALGLCFALTAPSQAQENEDKEVDSVYITPFAGAKIILVGKGMEKLLKENNLEVLKNKFVEDYQASARDKDFPATAKNIIYLAGADGRRRLKAIPDEVTPVNVKEEIKAFNSNLLPFHYTIYDLMKDYQYHIYVKGPEELDSLKTTNFPQPIDGAKYPNRFLAFSNTRAVEIIPSDTGYLFKNFKGGQPVQLELGATMGISLINSSLSPNIGGEFIYRHFSRHGREKYQFGFGYNFFVLTAFENKSFSSFYPISNYSLFFLEKYGNTGLGLSAGRFSTGSIFGSARNGSLDKAWKAGIISDYKNFRLEYDFIFDKQKRTNTAFTLRYYF